MSPPFDQRNAKLHTTVRLFTALTPREKQVLECVALGYSNLEIGERLRITSDCVKYHLKSVYAKLGARRRTHAVILAREFQILGPREFTDHPQVRIVA
jgi:DNA-binding CsgD family transcriptional regulator